MVFLKIFYRSAVIVVEFMLSPMIFRGLLDLSAVPNFSVFLTF